MAHWWYEIRFSVLKTLLERYWALEEDADILVPGCGGCPDFEFLSKYGKVYGFDPDEDLINRCKRQGIENIEVGNLPDDIAFGDKKFDAIFLLDVLEHIEDDRTALQKLIPLLKSKSSVLVITVPAFRFLWGDNDIYHRHKRRYTARQIIRLLKEGGYCPLYVGYFNFFFFPIVFIYRKFQMISRRIFKKDCKIGSDTGGSFGIFDMILVGIGRFESLLLKYIKFPFGVSIVAIAKKQETD